MGHQDCWRRQAWRRRGAFGSSYFPVCESGRLEVGSAGVYDCGLIAVGDVQAQERAKPDASAIYVPGDQTAKAIEEAIEAEIPLVVAVAEHVPIHDILRVSITSRSLLLSAMLF